MKPKINKEKCTGCGMCINLCPAAFKMGEDGKAEVIQGHTCSEKCNCKEAINSCPVLAISLIE